MGKTNPKLSPGWQCIWARVVAAISRHHQILSGEAKTVFVVTLWENARHFLHDFVLPGSLTVERTEHGQSHNPGSSLESKKTSPLADPHIRIRTVRPL